MNRTRLILTTKHVAYTLILLVVYVLQTTPGLFVVLDAKPMLVAGVAIAIAMHEGELAGGFYGAFAGLLSDMGGIMLFGFNGLLLAFFCACAGLLVTHLMHSNIWNAMLYTFISMMVKGSLEFLFGYGMWGYQYVWMIYVYHTLPLIIYTTATAPLMFLLVRWVHGRAGKAAG